MTAVPDFAQLAAPQVQPLKAYDPGYEPTEIKLRLGLEHIVEAGSNESACGASPRVLELLKAAPSSIVHRYPDAGGQILKRALADHYGLTTAHFTLGNGSHELLVLIAETFAGPGISIVYSQFGFAVYALAAQACGASGIMVPAAAALGANPTAMLAAITADTRLVYLANPNNPTGSFWDLQTLRSFIAALPPQVLLILDEAYFEFADPQQVPDGLKLLAEFPNLVVARTFSKAYGMAGLRVGYTISHPAFAQVLERTRLSFNVNQYALRAAALAISDQAHVQTTRQFIQYERARLTDALHALNFGLRVLPSQGNFILVDFAREASSIEAALVPRGVLVRPMRGYSLPNHLRITICKAQENDQLLAALTAVLKELN
jgi:histidinol-phosphate aminotransferase